MGLRHVLFLTIPVRVGWFRCNLRRRLSSASPSVTAEQSPAKLCRPDTSPPESDRPRHCRVSGPRVSRPVPGLLLDIPGPGRDPGPPAIPVRPEHLPRLGELRRRRLYPDFLSED
jgi:hypothetical protein